MPKEIPMELKAKALEMLKTTDLNTVSRELHIYRRTLRLWANENGIPVSDPPRHEYYYSAAFKKEVVEYYREHGIAATLDHYPMSKASLMQWIKDAKTPPITVHSAEDKESCFYRVFISKPGEFRDSSQYTFIGDFGSLEYAQRFIGHMYHDEDFPNPDTIVMKVPARPISVKDGTYDAVISCMGEVLHMDWEEMDRYTENMFCSMPEAYSIRRSQIPIRQERFKELTEDYYLDENSNWIVFHHPGHLLVYDMSSKYCILDATYEELGKQEDVIEDNPLVAVISSFAFNQDKTQCPDLNEDDAFSMLMDLCDMFHTD